MIKLYITRLEGRSKFWLIEKLSFLIILGVISINSFPQSNNSNRYQFISPIPGSNFVHPENNIIIREGCKINYNKLQTDLFFVYGTGSGTINGKIILANDGKSILFIPEKSFIANEKVIVKFEGGELSYNGDILSPLEFSFSVSDCESIDDFNRKEKKISRCIISHVENLLQIKEYNTVQPDTAFPEDLPNVYVNISNNPTDGYIFIAPWFFQGSFFDPNYMIIIDNYGIPIYYKKNDVLALDFKIHSNGRITYHDQAADAFIAMDSSYNIVDTMRCGNGYPTDFHDIQLLSNGNYLIMGQDYQTVRMDTIVPGGDTAAIVIGQIIQEKDEAHNVIFQWRSWDHFLITDASEHIDLTAHTIDYVHANSIELDFDGNIIVSCRNMEEITKIDRLTGDIIWRMGGKNNEFQFTNHPRGFSFQHDARILVNKNMTIFDNGNYLTPRYTTILEYNIDEVNRSLALDWSYSFNNHYAAAMGNAQRLPDGKTFIGWGSSWKPAATEVKYDGTKTFEISFDSLFYSYRAFRFPWRTNLLISDRYSVDFEYVPVNLSETKDILITNNSDEQLEITSYFSRTPLFSVKNNFPIVMEPFEDKTFQIEFFPDSVGVFSDDLHLRVIKENEMIAQVIKVLGYSDPNADVNENQNKPVEFELLQNYSNPFNPTTKIKYKIPEITFVTIKVFDILGNEITTLVNEEKPAGEYQVEFNADGHSGEVRNLPSGIYFYQLRATTNGGQAGQYVETKKMVLIK